MYNLLMVYQEGTWDEDEFILELPRYLEHTVPPLAERFATLTADTITALKGLPTLFAYEDRGRHVGPSSQVGRIEDIQVR